MMTCPTPTKRVFRSREDAQERADQVAAEGGDELEPYGDCPCRQWHLRNAGKNARKRVWHDTRHQRHRRLREEHDRRRAEEAADWPPEHAV